MSISRRSSLNLLIFQVNFGCCSTSSKALSQWTIYIIDKFFYLDNKNEIPGKNLLKVVKFQS